MNHYACAVLVKDGRVLLGLRAPHRKAYPNCWDVLGGRVESGETIEAALARELGEEVGVMPEVVSHIADIDDPAARGGAVYHLYAVTRWRGEPTMLNHEHTALQWFTIDDACALDRLALPNYGDLFQCIRALTLPEARPEQHTA